MNAKAAKVTVGDVERAVANAFRPEWAEPWDRNGLLCGDPDAKVSGVLVSLDPTRAAVKRAGRLGANVLVTHHPAFLEPPTSIRPGSGPAGVLFSALESGVALINAHTNLDRAPAAQAALPHLLGLKPIAQVERRTQPMALVTTFAPADHRDRVLAAMESAGAGRVGEYEGAAFVAEGVGSFTPLADAAPAVGAAGERQTGPEARIEMVVARPLVDAVVNAIRSAHPYEEPLITVIDVEIGRSIPRMGTLCRLRKATTLAVLARLASRTFGVKPRCWGDPGAKIASVVTATGSAGSLISDAVAAGADVLVAGEVRYHDALAAVQRGLAVIELGHDVSEWPLVPILGNAVRSTKNLDPVLVKIEAPGVGWWTP